MFLYLFDTSKLLKALDITWKGMGYLFLAMLLLFITVLLLNKLTNKKKD